MKKSITTLEKQLELMQLSTERATLESENSALQEQVQVHEASTSQLPAHESLLDQFMVSDGALLPLSCSC